MSFTERDALERLLEYAEKQRQEATNMYWDVIDRLREIDDRERQASTPEISSEDIKDEVIDVLKDYQELKPKTIKPVEDKPKRGRASSNYNMREIGDLVYEYILTHDDESVASKEIEDYLAEYGYTWSNFSLTMNNLLKVDNVNLVRASRGYYAIGNQPEVVEG